MRSHTKVIVPDSYLKGFTLTTPSFFSSSQPVTLERLSSSSPNRKRKLTQITVISLLLSRKITSEFQPLPGWQTPTRIRTQKTPTMGLSPPHLISNHPHRFPFHHTPPGARLPAHLKPVAKENAELERTTTKMRRRKKVMRARRRNERSRRKLPWPVISAEVSRTLLPAIHIFCFLSSLPLFLSILFGSLMRKADVVAYQRSGSHVKPGSPEPALRVLAAFMSVRRGSPLKEVAPRQPIAVRMTEHSVQSCLLYVLCYSFHRTGSLRSLPIDSIRLFASFAVFMFPIADCFFTFRTQIEMRWEPADLPHVREERSRMSMGSCSSSSRSWKEE